MGFGRRHLVLILSHHTLTVIYMSHRPSWGERERETENEKERERERERERESESACVSEREQSLYRGKKCKLGQP